MAVEEIQEFFKGAAEGDEAAVRRGIALGHINETGDSPVFEREQMKGWP